MARYARMAGKKTLWLPGTDHAGIATQVGQGLSAGNGHSSRQLPAVSPQPSAASRQPPAASRACWLCRVKALSIPL